MQSNSLKSNCLSLRMNKKFQFTAVIEKEGDWFLPY
jgi:hypothetical protein